MESCRYKSGVTLIEMMIVISIIALLVSIVLGAAGVIDRQAKERVTRGNFLLVEQALNEYHDFLGIYPDSRVMEHESLSLYDVLSGVSSALGVPSARKILQNSASSMVKSVEGRPEICDGWGTVLRYIYIEGQTFPQLISAGPDRAFDTTADNISNRQP